MPIGILTEFGTRNLGARDSSVVTEGAAASTSFVVSQVFEVTLAESVATVSDAWLSDRRVVQAVQLDEVVSIVADAWSSQKIAAGVIKTAAWSEQVGVSEGWVSSHLVITGKVAHIQMLLAKLDIDLTLEKLQ